VPHTLYRVHTRRRSRAPGAAAGVPAPAAAPPLAAGPSAGAADIPPPRRDSGNFSFAPTRLGAGLPPPDPALFGGSSGGDRAARAAADGITSALADLGAADGPWRTASGSFPGAPPAASSRSAAAATAAALARASLTASGAAAVYPSAASTSAAAAAAAAGDFSALSPPPAAGAPVVPETRAYGGGLQPPPRLSLSPLPEPSPAFSAHSNPMYFEAGSESLPGTPMAPGRAGGGGGYEPKLSSEIRTKAHESAAKPVLESHGDLFDPSAGGGGPAPGAPLSEFKAPPRWNVTRPHLTGLSVLEARPRGRSRRGRERMDAGA